MAFEATHLHEDIGRREHAKCIFAAHESEKFYPIRYTEAVSQ